MWWFEDWLGPLRVIVVGTAAYVSLIVLLRVTGKRTLSKLNAFDLIVTVALGSTLATILLSKNVDYVEGVTALILLIVLQYIVTWASVRFPCVQRVVKAEPSLIVHQGSVLRSAARRHRVSEEEILASVRMAGLSQIEDVAAVVLETDGSLSVIEKSKNPAKALDPVNYPETVL